MISLLHGLPHSPAVLKPGLSGLDKPFPLGSPLLPSFPLVSGSGRYRVWGELPGIVRNGNIGRSKGALRFPALGG